MLSLLLASLVAAAPAPKALHLPDSPRTLSAPLGHLGNVVDDVPASGLKTVDKPVVPVIAQCAPQAVYLMRMLGGTARAVEQLQQWLDGTPGFEARFFKRKATLTDVVKLLGDAAFEPKRACTAPVVKNGFQLDLDAAATRFCPSAGATQGDFWFFNKAHPAAVVNVAPGDPDACRLRLSTVLFDSRGQARVRLHADWGGAASVTLVGDGCQVVDFVLHSDAQSFVPTLKACKR
jgi:hypothetical protein